MSNKQKQKKMSYRKKLETLGFDVKKTFVRLGNRISNIQYSVSKNGKAYSFKNLKEAFESIDLF